MSDIPGQDGWVDALSCPTTWNCVAVGHTRSFLDRTSDPYVLTLAGGAWHTTDLPLGADTSNAWFTSVSCVSPTSCAAVGFRTQAADGADKPQTAALRGQAWSRGRPTLDPGLTTGRLAAVACRPPAPCRAVGSAVSLDGGQHPVSSPVLLG